MGFFFYFIIGLLALLLPIFIGVDGAFSLDRKLLFVVLKVYGFKVLSVKIYFDEKQGVLISFNGKSGKQISKKSKNNKNNTTKRNYLPMINALFFTKIDLTAYIGGEPQTLSVALGLWQAITETILLSLPKNRTPQQMRVELLPCYVNGQATVKFSICLFTTLALLLFAFAHTTKEENNAKRSNRKFDG